MRAFYDMAVQFSLHLACVQREVTLGRAGHVISKYPDIDDISNKHKSYHEIARAVSKTVVC
jgi:hypothetical protein